jgi:trk system potassium uptake protein TrkH
MDWRPVLLVLGHLLVIVGLCLLVPLGVALAVDSGSPREGMEILGFAVTAVLGLVPGLLLRHRFRGSQDRLGRREGFAVVTLAWVAAAGLGMLPFLFCGACGVTDAFFETMSGFTTTGASVFGSPGNEIEKLPHGLLLWRCMTQWLGGMGIVVLSVALLPFLGVGGARLLKAETPGGVLFERDRPRITDAARDLWKLYLLLSAAEAVLLLAFGASVFDACCHTFTTMSTGGFSPHGESAAFFGPATQWVLIVFMFLAGVSFTLHARLVRLRPGPALRSPELRLFAGLVLGAILLGALVVPVAGSAEEHLRTVAFQVVSIATTTGYATADFDGWPRLMRAVLLLLMLVGGCMGSTAGGIKVGRLLVFGKAVSRELHRLFFPHAVRPLKTGGRVVDPDLVQNILAFGALFVGCILAGTLVMAGCGYDLDTALSAAIAALCNIGPGLGQVGPLENWGHLPAAAKWTMSLLMLLGRLELFSVLALFAPWAWKR